jgi:hypothetical protein
LDGDTLGAIFVRLLAAAGTAEQLRCCGCVSKLWYECSLNESLWRVLLLRRCATGVGQEASKMLEAIESSQLAGREPVMSYRSQYIRSVTTQVLTWGHCGRGDDDARDAVRTPALIAPNGLRGVGVRSVTAGAGFSCAVDTRTHTRTYTNANIHAQTTQERTDKTSSQKHPRARTITRAHTRTLVCRPFVWVDECVTMTGDLECRSSMLGYEPPWAVWAANKHRFLCHRTNCSEAAS